jgi:hypothetical protein
MCHRRRFLNTVVDLLAGRAVCPDRFVRAWRMPRHATSEDAARNGFAPANLAPVAVGRGSAAVARPGLALEPRQGFGTGNGPLDAGVGSVWGLPRVWGLGAGGPPGSRSYRRFSLHALEPRAATTVYSTFIFCNVKHHTVRVNCPQAPQTRAAYSRGHATRTAAQRCVT